MSRHPAARPDAYAGPIPPHKLSQPTPTSRALEIDSWRLESCTTHIMNAAQIDDAARSLHLPLPEMTFADNYLTLTHAPSGFELTFRAMPSLAEIRVGEGWDAEGGGVKVKYAEEWGKTRTTAPSPLSPQTPLPTKPVKPFDWTYSTLYSGSLSSSSSASSTPNDVPFWRPARPDEIIPLDLLSRPDPILFYDEIPLFESELDDNGTSILSVRVRVMPHSLFVLQRHFLRVDGVLFRVRDVRVFHLFSTRTVIRETSGWEGAYDGVRARLPPPTTDLSPLSSSGWVHQTLSFLGGRSPPPGVRLEHGAKPWPGLGKKLEVLELPPVTTGTDGVEQGVGRITI